MKKLLIGLLIAVSFYTNGQETEFTFNSERGMTDYIVTQVEGKTAPEIYKKVIDWIKVTYKNPNEVILSTIENEYVRFEGISDKIKYQIELSIKDGKYKFDILNVQFYGEYNQYYHPKPSGYEDSPINYNSNSAKEDLKWIYKEDGTFKKCCVNTPYTPTFFNNLNKTILDSITSTVRKGDGW